MKHRETFGHRTHQAIEGTQFPDAVGGADDAGPTSTGIAVGRIGRIQFIG